MEKVIVNIIKASRNQNMIMHTTASSIQLVLAVFRIFESDLNPLEKIKKDKNIQVDKTIIIIFSSLFFI